MREEVILVDQNDREVGVMEKLEAHQKGLLHRAFSIFIFNSKGELLLQQRALDKYHSAGLWSNTCCSHPYPNESTGEAAKRRLQEEMGMTTPLESIFSFTYKAFFDNGLIENEFDYVYFGRTDDLPIVNATEVNDYKYVLVEDLLLDMDANPKKYTEWLKDCIRKVLEHSSEKINLNN